MADLRLLDTAVGPRDNGANFANFVLDSTTDSWAVIFDLEEAATITTVLVRQGAVTGTAPTYTIGIQTKAANGEPDGTYLGGGSENSVTFQPTGANDGTILALVLDNSIAITRGQSPMLCVVISYSSGTIDGSNNCSFSRAISGITDRFGMPYVAVEDSGTWTLHDDFPLIRLQIFQGK